MGQMTALYVSAKYMQNTTAMTVQLAADDLQSRTPRTTAWISRALLAVAGQCAEGRFRNLLAQRPRALQAHSASIFDPDHGQDLEFPSIPSIVGVLTLAEARPLDKLLPHPASFPRIVISFRLHPSIPAGKWIQDVLKYLVHQLDTGVWGLGPEDKILVRIPGRGMRRRRRPCSASTASLTSWDPSVP